MRDSSVEDSAVPVVHVLGDGDEAGHDITERLRTRGYRAHHHRSIDEYLRRTPPGDCVVLCLPVADVSLESLNEGLARARGTAPLIVAGSGDRLEPAAGLEDVFDYVAEPRDNPHRLLAAVGYALGTRQEDRELGYHRARDRPHLVGEDESMQPVMHRIRQIARRTAAGMAPTVLLLGETGTGKGLIAKSLHHAGARRNRPLVQVNCAAIPDNLVESELFGYERGAFTDAQRARAGLFETANGGTLFLDEVPSCPLPLQAKLLTAIEDKEIRRLGGRKSLPVDVQLIAASQPHLKDMMRSGAFRSDLYHRLNVISVTLPPLRERGEDRVRLATLFLREFCGEYAVEPKTLSEDALAFIRRYHWPGNVRELRNQIERIVLLSEEREVRAWQFERASGEFLRVAPDDAGKLQIRLPSTGISLERLEREVIREALELNDDNVSATARYLDVSRQTLLYRIKKHGLRSTS